MSWFHWKNGWCFRREDDGSVHVVQTSDGKFPRFRSDDADEKDRVAYYTNVLQQFEIPKLEWDSIVEHLMRRDAPLASG